MYLVLIYAYDAIILVVPGCLSANKIQYLCTTLLTFGRLLAFIYVVLHLFQDIEHHDCTLYYLMIFFKYVLLFFFILNGPGVQILGRTDRAHTKLGVEVIQ